VGIINIIPQHPAAHHLLESVTGSMVSCAARFSRKFFKMYSIQKFPHIALHSFGRYGHQQMSKNFCLMETGTMKIAVFQYVVLSMH
jgi:hypothetical protein